MEFDLFLMMCNYIGTIAFAVSGAVKGFKKKLDIFGISLLSIITAVGGGIIRD
ncbi:MAG: TRIC cation channel family protein, partial [Streptococcus sp.]|nr:TRIC cation channel family protein [Streptococcus sp.]